MGADIITGINYLISGTYCNLCPLFSPVRVISIVKKPSYESREKASAVSWGLLPHSHNPFAPFVCNSASINHATFSFSGGNPCTREMHPQFAQHKRWERVSKIFRNKQDCKIMPRSAAVELLYYTYRTLSRKEGRWSYFMINGAILSRTTVTKEHGRGRKVQSFDKSVCEYYNWAILHHRLWIDVNRPDNKLTFRPCLTLQ